jgi:hypothetical protein
MLSASVRTVGGATTPSSPEPVPVPIRALLPGDQEVVAHLWSRRQARDGWRYEVGLPAYRNGPGDTVEPTRELTRVWVRAPQHVRPVDGVSYDAVPTEYLERPSPVQEALGPRWPSGWVLVKAGGPGRGAVVHAVDCEEALDAAEQPGVRLCSLCGAAAELDPVLKGFEHGFGEP